MFVRFLLRNEVNDSNKIVGVLPIEELTEAFEFLRMKYEKMNFYKKKT